MNNPVSFDAYWVVPGALLAGEYPASKWFEEETRRRLGELIQLGIRVFIDLTRSGEQPPYSDLLAQEANYYGVETEYYRYAIEDYGVPGSKLLVWVLDAVDGAMVEKKGVYVHCWAGIGRTGTVVGCYLVRHGESGNGALEKLASLRSMAGLHGISPESPAQWKTVSSWREGN